MSLDEDKESRSNLGIHSTNHLHMIDGPPRDKYRPPKSYAPNTDEARSVLRAYLNNEQAQRSCQLLYEAANQLDVARFGTNLYQRMRSGEQGLLEFLQEGHQTVENVSANLVCRCSCTALDLCAASLYWIACNYKLKGGREADVGYWKRRRVKEHKIPVPLSDWIINLHDSSMWKRLEYCRNLYTHRWVRRDVTLVIGGPPGTGPTRVHIGSDRFDLADLLPDFLQFATSQIKLYCDSVIVSVKSV